MLGGIEELRGRGVGVGAGRVVVVGVGNVGTGGRTVVVARGVELRGGGVLGFE